MSEIRVKTLFCSTPQGFSGRLVKESQFVWRYETHDPACAISLLMPLRFESWNLNYPHPVFAMNLPEGEQFYRLRTRFAKHYAKFNDMAVLSLVGKNQIGRNRLSDNKKTESVPKILIGLNALKKTRASDELFEFLLDQYVDSGISGAQPKAMIPDGDSLFLAKSSALIPELIVKTGGDEYPFLSQNEFLCMMAARYAGMDVPEFHLSDDGSLFIIRRFDVIPEESGTLKQLGFEDFSVLSNSKYDAFGDFKYRGNYEGIAMLIGSFCQTAAHREQQKFFEYLALSCMVGNGDAHLKNFGLLYEHPARPESIRLSPLYDVVTTSVYEYADPHSGRTLRDNTLALKLNREKSWPTRKTLIEFGKSSCNVERPEAVIERIAESMTRAFNEYRTLFPQAFGEKLRKVWDGRRWAVSGNSA